MSAVDGLISIIGMEDFSEWLCFTYFFFIANMVSLDGIFRRLINLIYGYLNNIIILFECKRMGISL